MGEYEYACEYLNNITGIEKLAENGKTLLSIALSDDYPILAKILIEKGADVNYDNIYIYSAVDYMYYDLVKLLIEKGTEINNDIVIGDGDYDVNVLENAICRASSKTDWKIVELLIQSGAKLTDSGFKEIYKISRYSSWVDIISKIRKDFGDNMVNGFLRMMSAEEFNI